MFNETIHFLRSKGISGPRIGIVLGTGMNRFINNINVKVSIPYAEIPHFPQSTVEFHKGLLVYGDIHGIPVIIMQGRFHYYEGYSMQQVVYPIRIMKLLGIEQLLMSNAAGGIRKDLKKGDLVFIEDHINLQTANPLTGKNFDELGERFTDMSCPYDLVLAEKLFKTALLTGIELKQGVYAAVNGPNLETRAEYRYLQSIGADLVGMSTVPEVIAANHMQLPCAAISVVTDECDPSNLKKVHIQEIIAVAGKADLKLTALWDETLRLMSVEEKKLKTTTI